MTSILDQFRSAQSGFAARTPRDIFALRLAQKLNDASAAVHYTMLAAEHSETRLLAAYRRTVRESSNGDMGRRFQRELERTGEPQFFFQLAGSRCVVGLAAAQVT